MPRTLVAMRTRARQVPAQGCTASSPLSHLAPQDEALLLLRVQPLRIACVECEGMQSLRVSSRHVVASHARRLLCDATLHLARPHSGRVGPHLWPPGRPAA